MASKLIDQSPAGLKYFHRCSALGAIQIFSGPENVFSQVLPCNLIFKALRDSGGEGHKTCTKFTSPPFQSLGENLAAYAPILFDLARVFLLQPSPLKGQVLHGEGLFWRPVLQQKLVGARCGEADRGRRVLGI